MLYDPKWEVETPVTVEPWRNLLLDAAEIIRLGGWCQGEFIAFTGAVCMAGAISEAAREGMYDGDVYETAYNRISRSVRSPIDWNDTPGRTKDEVVDLLEKVAKE